MRVLKITLMSVAVLLLSTVGICQTPLTQGFVSNPTGPISGSQVYLFAVSLSGIGSAPTSLLSGTGVSTDGSGNGYITTNSSGYFNMTGLYSSNCPSSGYRVYVMATGGVSYGNSTNNSAISLVAALPVTCENLSLASHVIQVDEQSTAAAAYALVPFVNRVFGSDGMATTTGSTGVLGWAFNYANNVYDPFTTSSNIPDSTNFALLETVANILAACVNTGSSSSTECSTLTSNAVSHVGASNTWEAALNMVTAPTGNISTLYGLQTINSPYSGLSSAPSTFTLDISGAPYMYGTDPNVGSPETDVNVYGEFTGDETTNKVAFAGVEATYYSFDLDDCHVYVPLDAYADHGLPYHYQWVEVYDGIWGSAPADYRIVY